jgi:hypothetical protein
MVSISVIRTSNFEYLIYIMVYSVSLTTTNRSIELTLFLFLFSSSYLKMFSSPGVHIQPTGTATRFHLSLNNNHFNALITAFRFFTAGINLCRANHHAKHLVLRVTQKINLRVTDYSQVVNIKRNTKQLYDHVLIIFRKMYKGRTPKH